MRCCYACGKPLEGDGKPGRSDLCPHCRRDVHCCLNCRFYDEYAQNRCREPSAEWVGDREKNNFCDYFSFGESRKSREKEQQEARAKLEALFKKK